MPRTQKSSSGRKFRGRKKEKKTGSKKKEDSADKAKSSSSNSKKSLPYDQFESDEGSGIVKSNHNCGSIESEGGWSEGSGKSDNFYDEEGDEPEILLPPSLSQGLRAVTYDSDAPDPLQVDDGDFSEEGDRYTGSSLSLDSIFNAPLRAPSVTNVRTTLRSPSGHKDRESMADDLEQRAAGASSPLIPAPPLQDADALYGNGGDDSDDAGSLHSDDESTLFAGEDDSIDESQAPPSPSLSPRGRSPSRRAYVPGTLEDPVAPTLSDYDSTDHSGMEAVYSVIAEPEPIYDAADFEDEPNFEPVEFLESPIRKSKSKSTDATDPDSPSVGSFSFQPGVLYNAPSTAGTGNGSAIHLPSFSDSHNALDYDVTQDPIFYTQPEKSSAADAMDDVLMDTTERSDSHHMNDVFDDEGSMVDENDAGSRSVRFSEDPDEVWLKSARDQDREGYDGSKPRRQHNSRKTLLLACALACVLILLTGLGGGLLGAMLFAKDTETVSFVTPSPVALPVPTSMPTGTPTTGIPTAVPTSLPTSLPISLPTTPPTSSPTLVPTLIPTSSPSTPVLVTNQALFDTIANASFDGGAAIQQVLTPQQRAYLWLQNVDQLSNEARRHLRTGRRLTLPTWRIVQRYVMAVLYYATGGENWIDQSGWLGPDISECSWYTDADGGINCNIENAMTRLELVRNNINGTLPAEIGLLTDLLRINLAGDPDSGYLTGGIPTEIGLLTRLNFLGIEGNRLSEPLPDDFFEHLGASSTVLLSNNQLPGPIPASIANLTNANSFVLNNNAFTGSIPVEITAMLALTVLDLHDNFLTGELPTGLENLTLLKALDVSNNGLNGTLPNFSGWTTPLSVFDFSHNSFTGPLPDYFENLGKMLIFRANNNSLTGDLPPSLTNLTGIEDFDAAGNDLAGNVTDGMCTTFATKPALVYMDCPDEVTCLCCVGCEVSVD
jgi:Leucine-rich repeat (LRR) protein